MSITRRDLMTRSAGALAAAGAMPALAASSSPKRERLGLDLDKPLDNVSAYMKMRATIESGEVMFWYGGVLDLCVVGEAMRPLVSYETLVRRRVARQGPAEWLMTDWEGTFYRDFVTGEPIKNLLNPITNETVQVLDYLEGPVTFRYTEMEPRIIGSRDVLKKEGKPFHYPWRVAGDDIWMSKSGYIKTAAFLDPVKWPRASSGPDLHVSQTSVLNSKLSEVEDPNVATVDAYYSYEAASSWLPWLLMGQTPGYLIWHASGKKIRAFDEAPPELIANMQKIHPVMFEKDPWKDYTSVFLMYRDQRPAG